MIKKITATYLITLLLALNIPELLHHHECILSDYNCAACLVTKSISETAFFSPNINQALTTEVILSINYTDYYILKVINTSLSPRSPPAL